VIQQTASLGPSWALFAAASARTTPAPVPSERSFRISAAWRRLRARLVWMLDVPWLAQTMRPRIDEKLDWLDAEED
jgi:hypothetical protein